MQTVYKHLTTQWALIFAKFMHEAQEYDGYYEAIGFSYRFKPNTQHLMSTDSSLFNMRKAAAMYFWYKNGDNRDYSIKRYFKEYKHCTDEMHPYFNSNYGVYAYTQGGLRKCVNELIKHKTSRQAMFCINNNNAMSEFSIDKLCTNTIQFVIRKDKLDAIIQMRSSNFLTLLPYDAFMFSVFYSHVYRVLKRHYTDLEAGTIHMQVASLHLYEKDVYEIRSTKPISEFVFQMNDKNWQNVLEQRLLNALKEE